MSISIPTGTSNIISNPDEVIIGTQTWKKRNVNDVISGSKVYNDDEDNRAIYGGLYTYNMIADIEAANPGWHVPTLDDVYILNEYIADTFVGDAGGHLKEIGTDHWDSPNTGATDSVGFSALGAGRCIYSSFVGLKTISHFLLNYLSFGELVTYRLNHDSDNVTLDQTNIELSAVYISVRLIKD